MPSNAKQICEHHSTLMRRAFGVLGTILVGGVVFACESTTVRLRGPISRASITVDGEQFDSEIPATVRVNTPELIDSSHSFVVESGGQTAKAMVVIQGSLAGFATEGRCIAASSLDASAWSIAADDRRTIDFALPVKGRALLSYSLHGVSNEFLPLSANGVCLNSRDGVAPDGTTYRRRGIVSLQAGLVSIQTRDLRIDGNLLELLSIGVSSARNPGESPQLTVNRSGLAMSVVVEDSDGTKNDLADKQSFSASGGRCVIRLVAADGGLMELQCYVRDGCSVEIRISM